ncbi:P-loop containing nucleoside triphosphate hydrolase protein [Globomyces pollinis-pini]|nr:P-loop containing nucleoside triphosphate hydrolase protein [Globomyces pollinis-pini]
MTVEVTEKRTIAPNPWDFVTIGWLNSLIRANNEKPIGTTHDFELDNTHKTAANSSKLEGFWEVYRKFRVNKDAKEFSTWKNYGLGLALTRMVAPQIGLYFLLAIVLLANNYIAPYLVRQLILFVQFGNTDISSGPLLVALLLGSQVLGIVVTSLSDTIKRQIIIVVEEGLIDSIFKKTLKLSIDERSNHSPGKIMNLINNDSELVAEVFATDFATLVLIPFDIFLTVFFIYQLLGTAVFAGFGYIVLILIGTSRLAPKIGKHFMGWMNGGDQRISIVREVINGIKIIKFKAMEDYFRDKIFAVRQKQIDHLRQLLNTFIAIDSSVNSAAVVVGMICFVVYGAQGNPMSPEIIFPAFMYIKLLPAPLRNAAELFHSLIAGKKSVDRISGMLLADEMADLCLPAQEKIAISLKDVTWTCPPPPIEDDSDSDDDDEDEDDEEQEFSTPFSIIGFSADIHKGSFVGVIGEVGSGKSTLLNGLIGYFSSKEGTVSVDGSIAYCSQDPWIMPGTIESNILFGLDLDHIRMKEVIEVVGLERDLSILSDGIKTTIADGGSNVSGGQKARIALARALYSNSDIYILDCPLAALDATVSKYVFENAILGYLKDKTVVMVTHNLSYLSHMDKIMVLNEGKLAQFTTFDMLPTSLIDSISQMEKSEVNEDFSQEIENADEKNHTTVNQITAEEDKNSGAVGYIFYRRFIASIGTTYGLCYVLFTTLKLAIVIALPLWLTNWSMSTNSDQNTYYVIGYSILGVFNLIFIIAFLVTVRHMGVTSSCFFHDRAVLGVLNAPLEFFTANPTGRIINRLSSDVQGLDWGILNAIEYTTDTILNLISLIVLICFANAYLIFLMIFIVVSSYAVFTFFKKLNIELKRLKSIYRSPLDSHFSITLDGISTIYAFKKQHMFIQLEHEHMDSAQATNYLFLSLAMWLKIRLSLVASLATLAVGIIAITTRSESNSAFSSLIGLSLTYTTEIAGAVNWALTWIGQAEAEMSSVERLSHYGYDLPSEHERILPSDPAIGVWPKTGSVTVKDLQVSYPTRPDKPSLKNISFDIKSGEKIGVVGRTGSGKSTLATTFFRILELQKGSIQIDGQDIQNLGLYTLRSRLEIINQEPTLFSGTIRSNLDHSEIYSDEELWNALNDCGLKDFVSSLDGKLDAIVTSNGDSLSAGQRQLLCLARSLLAKPILLVMDEATAQIDALSDSLVQKVISNMKNTTVISIAHRLTTISNFDKVIVLDAGEMVEFDYMHVLLSDSESALSQLCNAYDSTTALSIRAQAKSNYEMSNR